MVHYPLKTLALRELRSVHHRKLRKKWKVKWGRYNPHLLINDQEISKTIYYEGKSLESSIIRNFFHLKNKLSSMVFKSMIIESENQMRLKLLVIEF